MSLKLQGWVDCWTSPYPQTSLNAERKRLLVECIRRRHYNFTHQSHQNLPFAAPFYSDGKLCCLTKEQWDEVMSEAYTDIPLGHRLLPQDAIKSVPKNSVLYEKGNDNG